MFLLQRLESNGFLFVAKAVDWNPMHGVVLDKLNFMVHK
jgi:hypothetical protein